MSEGSWYWPIFCDDKKCSISGLHCLLKRGKQISLGGKENNQGQIKHIFLDKVLNKYFLKMSGEVLPKFY